MKLVALVQVMSADQDKQFVAFLSASNCGYWHWIDGSWLITVPPTSTLTAASVRDKLKTIAPDKHSLVFEVQPRSPWAGFGPNSETRNMFQWLRNKWFN